MEALNVNASIRHIRVTGLQSKEYEFRMAASNTCGQSPSQKSCEVDG